MFFSPQRSKCGTGNSVTETRGPTGSLTCRVTLGKQLQLFYSQSPITENELDGIQLLFLCLINSIKNKFWKRPFPVIVIDYVYTWVKCRTSDHSEVSGFGMGEPNHSDSLQLNEG